MFVSWSSVHYFLVAPSDDPTSIPDGDSPGVAVVSCSPGRGWCWWEAAEWRRCRVWGEGALCNQFTSRVPARSMVTPCRTCGAEVKKIVANLLLIWNNRGTERSQHERGQRLGAGAEAAVAGGGRRHAGHRDRVRRAAQPAGRAAVQIQTGRVDHDQTFRLHRSAPARPGRIHELLHLAVCGDCRGEVCNVWVYEI